MLNSKKRIRIIKQKSLSESVRKIAKPGAAVR